jgi:hypothetical protein
MSKTLRFRARMKIRDGNPFVLVSAARVRTLKPDWRGPMPVLVRVDGKPEPRPWRITMMPVGNAYRNGPMHPMPSWFRLPLSRNAKASRAWDALIPSRKKEILRYFSWLKSSEARERNVARALHVLSGRKGRFMARSR